MRYVLMCVMILTLMGCASSFPKEMPRGVGDKIGDVIGVSSGKAEAREMWTPFIWAGTVGLIGGIGMFAWKKDWSMLIAGAAIAAMPPLITLVATPLLPWFALGSLLAGSLLVGRLGWWVWDSVADGLRENRQDAALKALLLDSRTAESERKP